MKRTKHTGPSSENHRLYIGTSGYAYTDWVEAGFYPSGTKSGNMLPLYAERFSITELNYTWYRMPNPETIDRQSRMVKKCFRFAAKLTRTMTHEIRPAEWQKEAEKYREGIAPLVQSGRLAAVLIQLPPSFQWTSSHRRHLAALLDALEGLPLAVEFRHDSWVQDKVFAELERRNVTLVTVDVPGLPRLFPPLDVVTNPDLFYVRFHGRNLKGWRSGKMAIQFDYDYADEELAEWVEEKIMPMAEKCRKGILFFNNHVRGQAAKNAAQLIQMLLQNGVNVI